MRARSSSVLAALVLVTGAAAAQQKASETPPRGAEATRADPGKVDPKADPGKAAAGEEKDKKPSITPGYSWSDKPAKPGKRPPRKKPLDPNAPIAMFPGFRVLPDGSSQVWVHVTKKVNVTAAAASFVLVGAQVNVRNNTHALVTEFFDTPLARARLKPDAAGAQLVLELRENVAVKHRVVDGPGGSMVLYVDLPRPQRSYAPRDDFAAETSPLRGGGAVLPGKGTSRRGPRP